jgi:hypothetical protein
MCGFVTKVKVNKPVEHTFRLFLDEEMMAHWISGFKGIEILSGKPRSAESLYRMMIDFNGEALQIYQKILEVHQNERLLIHMEHPEFITYSEILFEEAGTGTDLLCKVKIEGKNLKMKLAMPFVKSILVSRNEKDYMVFKQVAEKKAVR